MTGQSDINGAKGFQVAHFVPRSLLDGTNDSLENIKDKIRNFIRSLCPWLPLGFFENIDSCENAIFLNQVAHRYQGSFKWFVVKENNHGQDVYKAMHIENDGLLEEIYTGRHIQLDNDIYKLKSSYNQPLFIGGNNGHPPPADLYIRLHELLARIFHVRGYASYYEYDSDDEEGNEISLHDEEEEISKYREMAIERLVQNCSSATMVEEI